MVIKNKNFNTFLLYLVLSSRVNCVLYVSVGANSDFWRLIRSRPHRKVFTVRRVRRNLRHVVGGGGGRGKGEKSKH